MRLSIRSVVRCCWDSAYRPTANVRGHLWKRYLSTHIVREVEIATTLRSGTDDCRKKIHQVNGLIALQTLCLRDALHMLGRGRRWREVINYETVERVKHIPHRAAG